MSRTMLATVVCDAWGTPAFSIPTFLPLGPRVHATNGLCFDAMIEVVAGASFENDFFGSAVIVSVSP